MDRFEETGGKHHRDGIAKHRGLKTQCKKILCIISADKALVFDLAFEASLANDCYEVEIHKDNRLNVYFSRWTYTNESSVGDAWAKYAAHPNVWSIVQDDAFCATFKDRIRNYQRTSIPATPVEMR